MWLATNFGFYSIVKHRRHSGMLLVRGRVLTDIQEMARRCVVPLDAIVEMTHTDYRYRFVVSRHTLAGVLHSVVLDDVDYPNFKDEVLVKQGLARATVYGDVWATLCGLVTVEADEAFEREHGS